MTTPQGSGWTSTAGTVHGPGAEHAGRARLGHGRRVGFDYAWPPNSMQGRPRPGGEEPSLPGGEPGEERQGDGRRRARLSGWLVRRSSGPSPESASHSL